MKRAFLVLLDKGEKSGDVRERRQGRNTPKEAAAEFPAEPPRPAAEGQIQILLYSILGLNLQQSACKKKKDLSSNDQGLGVFSSLK